MAQRPDLAIEAIASRASVVTENLPHEPVGDPRYDATHVGCRSVALAEEANFPLPACLRNRDGVSPLGHIDSDECFLQSATALPPVMRIGSVRPSNPRTRNVGRAT